MGWWLVRLGAFQGGLCMEYANHPTNYSTYTVGINSEVPRRL